MATSHPLIVEVDCPEPRPVVGRLCVGADGTSWDRTNSESTVFFDSVTNTAFLAPLPLTAAWASNWSGLYARTALASYSLITPGVYKQVQISGAGDYYVTQTTTTVEWVPTTASYGVNQPIYVSAYVPTWTDSSAIEVLRVQWGYGEVEQVEISFRANGTSIVYKNGEQKGIYDQTDTNRAAGRSVSSATSIGQRNIAICIIPFKRREMLVLTNFGTNFAHMFEDLDADDQAPTVLPAGPFAWKVQYGRPTVQIAPIFFEDEGKVYSRVIKLRYPPAATMSSGPQAFNDLVGMYSAASASGAIVDVVLPDGSPYTPDGIIDEVRLEVTLTALSSNTIVQGISAAMYFYDTLPVDTSNSPVDITTAISDLTLSVDETSRCTLKMSGRYSRLADAGVELAPITSDRPIRVEVGGIDIFRGSLTSPQVQYEQGDTSSGYDWSVLEFEGQDRLRDFELSHYQDAQLFDGILMQTVVEEIMYEAGYDNTYLNWQDTSGFTIPRSPDIARGYSTLVPQRGDTVQSMLSKVKTDYAANWITGWSPTLSGYLYQWSNPADISNTSTMTLYQSPEAAIAASVSADLVLQRTIRKMSAHYEAPEANQITVLGQDPRNGDLIYAYDSDSASQDPATAPVSRPDNWRGRPVAYLLAEPGITSQAAATQAVATLADRLMTGRYLVEWESDFLVRSSDDRPLWLRDAVTIMDPDGTTVKGIYRIIAIPSINFQIENGTVTYRSATYRGLYLGV